MRVVARPHQAGKTTELLHLAHLQFAYIVCPTAQDVEHLWCRARELALNIPQPITWAEFASGRYRGAGIKSFIIDDVDRCLQGMTSVEISAISVNADA